jgi:signal transduction histidine kinase
LEENPHIILQEIRRREQDLAEREEELESQQEELTAAVEQLIQKNTALEQALTELKERNYELDQLLYRSSHDLRSPVVSILGIIHLMEAPGQLPQELVPHIRKQAEQMMRLVTSLTLLAEVGAREPNWETTKLADIIEACCHQVAMEGLTNKVPRVIWREAAQKAVFPSDPYLLKRVLEPLVENAIVFGEQNNPPIVDFQVEKAKERLKISITNTGEPISEEVGPNIFEMFYRGSEKSIGHGLGLYIANKATQRLKGEIHWTSKNGSTTFWVVLPLYPYSDLNK